MWPFKRKTDKPYPLLKVLSGDMEVCSVMPGEVPVEKVLRVELSADSPLIRFVDGGKLRSFDLSSAFAEGARFIDMSVRVSASFAVQVDGILTATREEDSQAAFRGGAKGVRFQPFLLPESSGRNEDTVGRGLFFRGLHFSGMVTQGNVSLMCLCDRCEKSFRLQSFHAGFSNLVYFYCSRGTHAIAASSYAEDAPPVAGQADIAATERFEKTLPACGECGGSFRYLNPLLCPHCAQPYIDFAAFPREREGEYYGNYLYGGVLQRHEPRLDLPMKILIERDACCGADDQIGPLALSTEMAPDSSLEEFVQRIRETGFLQYTATHHTIFGEAAGQTLVSIGSETHAQGEIKWFVDRTRTVREFIPRGRIRFVFRNP